MAITKKQIINTINAMPEDEFEDIDVLLERMMMLKKLKEIFTKTKPKQTKKLNNTCHHGFSSMGSGSFAGY